MTRSSASTPDGAPAAAPSAPKATPDAAAPGSVELRFLGHATTLIEINGVRILTDPFLRARLGALERHGPLPDPAELEVDVVVISHGHPDHFDARSIAALPGRPRIVVPRGLGEIVGRVSAIPGDVSEVLAGETVEIAGLTIRAVPARHWISPRATRAEPIGYVLERGATVYFAGDTGRFPGMQTLAGGVDVALLPVWTWGPHLGPGHLGPRSAADALRDIAPQAAVPIHWGTLYPRHLHRVWRRPLTEPADRFADHARRIAPEVDVRVLSPGEATSIEVGSSSRQVPRRPDRP